MEKIIAAIIGLTLTACGVEAAPIATPAAKRPAPVCQKFGVVQTETTVEVLTEVIEEVEVSYADTERSFTQGCSATTTTNLLSDGGKIVTRVWTSLVVLPPVLANQHRTKVLAEGCLPGTECETLHHAQEGNLVKVHCGETSVHTDAENNVLTQSGSFYDRAIVHDTVTTETEETFETVIETEVEHVDAWVENHFEFVAEGEEVQGEVIDCLLVSVGIKAEEEAKAARENK